MRLSCFVVSVYLGANGPPSIEAGTSVAQTTDPQGWMMLFPRDPDRRGVVVEILGKLKEALEKGEDGIEVTTTGRFILKTPAMVAAALPLDLPRREVPTPLIDLNKATEENLRSLPGVGPATATKIVAGRPYKNVDELQHIEGIGEAKLAGIKPLVTV